MFTEMMVRFFLAAMWGGIVGAEREYRSKSAGFRTITMISTGSCLFTILSMHIGGLGNPDRIASNIVTGIGFLGAGVIFRGDNKVNGITTAATIWAVAAVGMSIGAGYYEVATIAGVNILIILALLPYFEKYIDTISQTKTYSIECAFDNNKIQEQVEHLMKIQKLAYNITKYTKENNDVRICWSARGAAKKHIAFIEAISTIGAITKFEY